MAWAPEHLFEEAPQSRPPARLALARGSLADYAAAPPMQVLRQLESTWHGLAEGEAQGGRLIQGGVAAHPGSDVDAGQARAGQAGAPSPVRWNRRSGSQPAISAIISAASPVVFFPLFLARMRRLTGSAIGVPPHGGPARRRARQPRPAR